MDGKHGRADPANEAEREWLERTYPKIFAHGARAAFGVFPKIYEPGGYSRYFDRWPLERRKAWFAGFSVGFRDRRRPDTPGIGGAGKRRHEQTQRHLLRLEAV
jgi:hypothetical protein